MNRCLCHVAEKDLILPELDPVVVGHQVAGQEGPPGEGPLPRTLDSGAVHVHRLSLVRLCRDIGNRKLTRAVLREAIKVEKI